MTMDTDQMLIFGAGLSGLIAARMMADRHPIIMEAQSSLPNNHKALLRFRSSVVGDVTNVPFKKVQVTKYVLRESGSNPLRDAAVYARKATGKLHERSIIDTRPSERYIAPPDFIQRLASTAKFEFNRDFADWTSNLVRDHAPVVSTIPVPAMMDLFGWKDKPDFQAKPGWTARLTVGAELECTLNGTLYSARESDLWYRASITDGVLMVEGVGEPPSSEELNRVNQEVAWQFGLYPADFSNITMHKARYQKIADLDTAGRESVKTFIMMLSQKHRIYSLGRFATWRPKLLLDDLVKDVRVICRLIDGESHYSEALAN